jgi:glycerophosphoryl diester phosphodiesterase
MIAIAHRGASGYEPENTLAAFKKALELGVDMVELDVYVLEDGNVVVIHDKKVNRTTNGKGYVRNKTVNELKQLDAGNGETIPTLQEVLDLVKRKAKVNIELKGKGTAQPVSNILKEYIQKKGWNYTDFLVSSFDHNELRAFTQLLPQILIGVLIIGIFVQFDKYKKMNAYSVHMWSKLVRKSLIEKAHKRGLKLFVYTVNNSNEIKKMKDLGVDGIFSNYPDKIS